VILYSEGFESSKNLAQKMVQMYKLCSEQLSQQDHYDFGMRALKSVLVMAGSLKRQNPDKNEDVVLLRALRDSNLPKFLKDDSMLFQVHIFFFFLPDIIYTVMYITNIKESSLIVCSSLGTLYTSGCWPNEVNHLTDVLPKDCGFTSSKKVFATPLSVCI